jgi:CRISPR/Cas system-associated protein Cas10 (large subunit of type III CRISPR-Cas system)
MFYAKRIRKLEARIKQLEEQSIVHVWSGCNYYSMTNTNILRALLEHLQIEIKSEPSKLTFIHTTKEAKQ